MDKNLHTFVICAYNESIYLENCIKSVLKQKYKSKVIIATSTPNDFITSIASKYNLNVIINPNKGNGIGADFDFALFCGKTDLVTVAHQDDIYDEYYSYEIVNRYDKNPNSIIIFSDYYEIRNNQKVYTNINLKIKRLLMFFVKFNFLSNKKFGKRSCLAFGNAICCPAVTFVKKNIPYEDIFSCNMKCDIDWFAWERLSKEKGSFAFVKNKLMGHRVHEESTTTEIINENVRTKEDLIMFKKFWPFWFAKVLNNFYVKSENSNKVK